MVANNIYTQPPNRTLVQNAEIMKLTQSEITDIHKLDVEKAIEVLHECAERLGLVSEVMDEMGVELKNKIADEAPTYSPTPDNAH